MPRILVMIVLVLALSACVTRGEKVTRIPEAELTLGSTTENWITERLGEPNRVLEQTENGQDIRTILYTYVSTATNDSQISGVGAGRSQAYNFFDDTLVGYQFVSSFKSESTDFDDSVVASFEKGRTTLQEVISALGAPSGRRIYPLIKDQDVEAIRYVYTFVDTRKAGFPRVLKRLTIVLDDSDVVQDIDLYVE